VQQQGTEQRAHKPGQQRRCRAAVLHLKQPASLADDAVLQLASRLESAGKPSTVPMLIIIIIMLPIKP
jgi:hypothetical protein